MSKIEAKIFPIEDGVINKDRMLLGVPIKKKPQGYDGRNKSTRLVDGLVEGIAVDYGFHPELQRAGFTVKTAGAVSNENRYGEVFIPLSFEAVAGLEIDTEYQVSGKFLYENVPYAIILALTNEISVQGVDPTRHRTGMRGGE